MSPLVSSFVPQVQNKKIVETSNVMEISLVASVTDGNNFEQKGRGQGHSIT